MARQPIKGGTLSADDRKFLQGLIRQSKVQFRHYQRAQIMLSSDAGLSNAEVAAKVGVNIQTVHKVLKKWASLGMAKALEDSPRNGRPIVIGDDAKAWIVSLACTPVEEVPEGPAASAWTISSLNKYIRSHCEAAGYPELNKISQSTVW